MKSILLESSVQAQYMSILTPSLLQMATSKGKPGTTHSDDNTHAE